MSQGVIIRKPHCSCMEPELPLFLIQPPCVKQTKTDQRSTVGIELSKNHNERANNRADLAGNTKIFPGDFDLGFGPVESSNSKSK